MIKIICVGKVKEKYLRDAISDYEKRISKYYKIDIIEVNDSNMKEEAIKIKQHIKSNDYVITLEIEGSMLTSIELANKIDKIFITNPNIIFIVGGSDGLDKSIKEISNYKLLIKEEKCGTCIFSSKIFSANKYLDDLTSINKIINLSNINEEETKIILNNYNNKDLDKLLGVDNYFLENKIAYKVGDLND